MFSTKTFYDQWRLGLLYSNLFCYHKGLVIIIYTDLKSKYNLVCLALYFAQVRTDSDLLGNFITGY
ncbi:uncharacterized protein fragment [Streptococcus troglodytae]|uniref:Uncharacterized protein n=1 Tax=Streptococcus troglodytae TaxID=1111760 RepID=A0A1L7LL67_9STRE|nr:uncharacterized protein fragment [Streptococcus troglodytae]